MRRLSILLLCLSAGCGTSKSDRVPAGDRTRNDGNDAASGSSSTPAVAGNGDPLIEVESQAREEAFKLYTRVLGWIQKHTPEHGPASDSQWQRMFKENKLPLDPWKRPYTLRRAHPSRWRIWPMASWLVVHSAGADGKDGTRDDISRPEVNDPRVFLVSLRLYANALEERRPLVPKAKD